MTICVQWPKMHACRYVKCAIYYFENCNYPDVFYYNHQKCYIIYLPLVFRTNLLCNKTAIRVVNYQKYSLTITNSQKKTRIINITKYITLFMPTFEIDPKHSNPFSNMQSRTYYMLISNECNFNCAKHHSTSSPNTQPPTHPPPIRI